MPTQQRAGRVVSRSFAEWCGVIDIVLATQLVLAPLV
jgi:hypothetical protein